MKLTKWLYSTLATVLAGFVATNLVKLVWRVAGGSKAPTDPDDPEASTWQVTLFAAALAAAVAAAQTVAGRKVLKRLDRA
ncbi:MAG: DUF4235 domain-containing protein [Bifidobacteriaceae bacterium]|jgi:hypothetical protein|nr:DUF4235 domain-containing protein [Bifidobacteriaceae bacterium]